MDASAANPGSCKPTGGVDEPDEAFADTDCDGIDGAAASAIFVAPTGNDQNAGTMSKPVATLTRGLALAAQQSKDLYVCNAQYQESLAITQAVRVYGGYDCARGWQRVTDRASVLSSSGPALRVSGASGTVRLERVRLEASGSTAEAGSSIAAVVAGSTDVVFSRVDFVAGDAGPGKAGQAVASYSTPQNIVGSDAADTSGVSRCTNVGTTAACLTVPQGGWSGASAECVIGPGAGNTVVSASGGRGGNGGNILASVTAQPGSPGTFGGGYTPGSAGSPGTAAAGGFGGLSTSGDYLPTGTGERGSLGAPGLAGSGGAGAASTNGGLVSDVEYIVRLGGGGGQGGYPGCGGEGGYGGGGGGASIGVAVVSSAVRVEWCHITTGQGGAGGTPSPGGAGQPGSAGGRGGAGTGVNPGEPGAAGGQGGTGGEGGPGGGGPSVGIAYVGSAPEVVSTSYALGRGGPGGAAQTIGVGPAGPVAEVYGVDGGPADAGAGGG